jgi:hypothetical protein
VPALGAAGLSLTLASEASLATTAPALDTMTRNAGISYQITLREEEACDISLATFHVFDKEGSKTFQPGESPVTQQTPRSRPAVARHAWRACCLFACLAGQAAESNTYSPPPPLPIRPADKPIRKKRYRIRARP